MFLGDNMNKNISDEIIEKVKYNSDIVNIISDYVQLKKSGSNFIGICPFHNEKTPSFTVSQTKQIYHCFGCGEGGDGVNFIMKKENLDFPDAIKFLADKLGIEIYESNNEPNYQSEKEKTYEINREAAYYFHNNLIKDDFALEYLNKRCINIKLIKQFGLGFSLDSWDSLLKHLKEKGFKEDEINKTGLIGKKSGNNGYYDRFRNRIIFPIIDAKSRVIGFGGRVLDDSMPKYLNSPDTIVFNKGNNLYGLNLLNKLSDRKRILLVEGYMDVISLFKNGINYSIASLGTALTERQSKLIKRFGEEVYICYDSDSAGIKATLKAIDIFLKIDISPRIIVLPDGMDPDDYIKSEGLFNFNKQFNNSLGYLDFKIFIAKRKFNLEDLDEKIKFTIEIAKIIKDLKSPIEQDVYIEKISKETGISKYAIESEIKGKNTNIEKRNISNNRASKDNIRPMRALLPSAQIKAEADLIKLMIKEKDFFEYISKKLKIDNFESMESKCIINLLDKHYKDEELANEDELVKKILEIPNLDKKKIQLILNDSISYQPSNINQIIDDLIKTLLLSNLLNKRKDILIEIEDLEKKDRTDLEEITLKKLCFDLIEINKDINLSN